MRSADKSEINSDRRNNGDHIVHDTEKLFEALVESATDYAIFSMDAERVILTWNGGAERLLGYREEEIVGRSGDTIFTSEEKAAGAPDWEAEKALAEGRCEDDRWHVRKDDSRFFATGVMMPLRASDGETKGFVKVLRDNTKQKLTEDSLQKSEQHLRSIFQSVHDYAIFTLDPSGNVTSWNEGACQVKGYTADEIIGKPVEIFYTPEDAADGKPRREMQTALETGRSEDESWRVHKDGSLFWVNEIMTPFLDADGHLLGFTKISRDLTERRRSEERLRLARDELEIKVQERTKVLLEITESLELEVKERQSAETRVKELLRRLITVQEEERRRISGEIHAQVGQEMTALRLKLDSINPESNEHGSLIREQLEQAQRMAEDIDFNVDYLAWELRPAMLDEIGIEAALRKLVRDWSEHTGINAEIEAATNIDRHFREEIEINLYRIVQEALNNVRRHAGANNVNIFLSQRDGSLGVVIEDDGIGFDAEQNGSAKNGDGMGLINIRERLALIGGTLQIESESGKGTTIFLRLPTT